MSRGRSVIFKWNPAFSNFNMYDFLDKIRGWDEDLILSVQDYDQVKDDDQFYLLKVGCGSCGIIAAGYIKGEPFLKKNIHGNPVYHVRCCCSENMVNPDALPILETDVLQDDIPDVDWLGGDSGIVLTRAQSWALLRLHHTYVQKHKEMFIKRLLLIEELNLENDQLYMPEIQFDLE